MTYVNFIRGLLVGAGVMYLLDPEEGRRRRGLIRDQGIHLWHNTRDFLGKAGRDLGNRARGRIAELRGRLRPDHPSGDVLVERVRAKLGRYVSHPRAIDVEVEDGGVTLRGPILSAETRDLISALHLVPGVTGIVNQLEEHDSAANVPALQGGSRRVGEPPEWAQANWTPAFQLLLGLAGAAAVAYGTRTAVRVRRRVGESRPNYAYLR